MAPGGRDVAEAKLGQPEGVYGPAKPERVADDAPGIGGIGEDRPGRLVVAEEVFGVADVPERLGDADLIAKLAEDRKRLVGHRLALADVVEGHHVREALVVERLGDGATVAGRPGQGQRFVVERLGPVHLAAPVGEPGSRVEPLPSHDRIVRRPRQRQDCEHSLKAFAEVAPHLPEAPQRATGGQPERRVIALDGPDQRETEVVMLDLQAVEPGALADAREVGLGGLRQGQECRRVASPDLVELAGFLEALTSVVADRLEHPEAGFAGRLVLPDQALVDERGEAVEHVDADLGGGPADRLRLVERHAAREYRRPVEEPARAGVEQVIAPRDRPAQRLLALGQAAARRGEQIQALAEASQDRVRREQLDAGRGELDGEWQAVEATADVEDGRGIGVGQPEVGSDGHRALHEQRHALRARQRFGRDPARAQVGQPERRDRVFLLARDVQDSPAADDDLRARADAQDVSHERRRGNHLLEVVEDEQHGVLADEIQEPLERRALAGFQEADRGDDGRGDELRLGHRIERDEEHAIGELLGDLGGDLEAESGLAGAAGSGQRQESRSFEEGPGGLDLAIAPDEARQLGRQVVRGGVERAQGREVGRQPGDHQLVETLRSGQVLQAALAEVPQRDALGQRMLDEYERRR